MLGGRDVHDMEVTPAAELRADPAKNQEIAPI